MKTKEFYLDLSGSTIKTCFLKNDTAEKPIIVFLHDSLGCITLWRDFPRRLAEMTCCSVLIYDRQGYGDSSAFINKRNNLYLEKEAEVLKQIIDKMEIKKTILFGHSDGGSIALIAAAKYPELIKGIICEGAHVFVEELTITGIRKAKDAYLNTNLRDKLQKYHRNNTESLFNAWVDTWLSAEFRTWNIESYLENIICPVLAIQGENDEYGTIEQLNSISTKTAGKTKAYLVPGASHSPHKESVDDVLEKSLIFVEEINYL